MSNKITKREVINAMLNEEVIKANETYVTYLKHEIELLDKKKATRKPTKKQEENEVLKEIIKAVVPVEGATVTEISTRDERLSVQNGITVPRITSALKTLIEEGVVKREVVKGKALYSKVETDEVEG
jgi:DNA-binding transcriptional ArsR family regulator